MGEKRDYFIFCVICRVNPRRRNVTAFVTGLKNSHIRKNLTPKMVNLRDIGGNVEVEKEFTGLVEQCHDILLEGKTR